MKNGSLPCIQYTVLDEKDPEGIHVSSNWSERHAAYASGLGTFCLSRGLISSKGVAGRYASIIVSEYFEPDERTYTGIYDYCIHCGACIRRCPVNAITLEDGKNQRICKEWIDKTSERYAPRYGCGKCQTVVPCESRIPDPVFRGD
ncbi:MAG: 4Fe-4S binding protein [Parasporobacterium sp.]|nr:4Fe-4S binding protein [Parasporobacterium sp.]